jgi:hypothetical protein
MARRKLRVTRGAALLAVATILITVLPACGRHRGDRALVPPSTSLLPEHALLDVQILPFDPGVPEARREAADSAGAAGGADPAGAAAERGGEAAADRDAGTASEVDERVYRAIRRAEANYFPCKLRSTLMRAEQWGAVEIAPRRSDALDLTIEGTIVKSDGDTLKLDIDASDATGRRWLDKTYEVNTTEAQYMDLSRDPYQPVYNSIANDLAEVRNGLSGTELRNIRTVSELRFAESFAPDGSQGFLEETDDGILRVTRLPARDDPMHALLAEVRGRETMFIATQSGHYEQFCAGVAEPYARWQWFAREETVAYKKLRRDALMRKGGAVGLAALAVLGGVMGNPAGLVQLAVLGGGVASAALWSSGSQKTTEAKYHRESLDEANRSFDTEVRPMVVDVEGRTVRLTGSVEEQYEEWRRLLHELYEAEGAMPQNLSAHIVEDDGV